MEHSISPKVARLIRAELDEANISQRQVERDTGIAIATLNRRLTGNSPLNLDELDLIAGVLKTKPSELIGRAEAAA